MAQLTAHPPRDVSSRVVSSPIAAALIRDVLPQLLAIAAALVVIVANQPLTFGSPAVPLLIAVSLGGLRVATAQSELARSTFVLDAAAIALLVGGTADTRSPFIGLAVAGAWWAARAGRHGTLYGASFVAAYLVLVVPAALRGGEIAAAIYQPALVAIVAVLLDQLSTAPPARWAFTILDRRAQPAKDSVRVGLSRAIRGGLVPIDVLLTAGQLGLTVEQTELIPYLILGLSNQEIADALSVSEATVRYRLTRLYRVLDVRGRKAAAERARELGLDALVSATSAQSGTETRKSALK